MPETSATTLPPPQATAAPVVDDIATIFCISVVAAVVSDVLHEGVGHGLTALLTGAPSGLLTSASWSSQFDSRAVEAGGTLVNLAAGLVLWLVLRSFRTFSLATRAFLLVCCAFNLLSGTGYLLFSGVSDFGDWAAVIQGLHPHWLWRTVLIVVGSVSYYAAARMIGTGLVRYVGIPPDQQSRLRRFTLVPYVAAIVLSCAAALLNPLGRQLLWQSALPATAGGHSAMLWLQYPIPRRTAPSHSQQFLSRRYRWIIGGIITGLLFTFVLGRGITLHW